MANEVGTALGLEDLFTKILRFTMGNATFTNPVFTGTGNGTMTGLDTYPAAVTENWTVTCTVAAANGGTFSVVGSISGAQANAIVGTPYDNAKIKFLINDGAVDFLVGDSFTFTTTAGVMPTLQRWQAKRIRRDNLAAMTTSYAQPTTAVNRTVLQTLRYDPRSLNTDLPTTTYQANFYVGTVVGYVQMQLREARAVSTVRLRAPRAVSHVAYMIKNFRLQYSDDGVAWTTLLTVNSAPVYTLGEFKDWAVPASGPHLHWKILVDTAGTSAVAWESMLLLEADGTVANHFGSEAILMAPGNAGTEQIYTGIRSEYDTAAGWHNLFLNGYTGFDANEMSWFEHPGALPDPVVSPTANCAVPMVPCWDTSMPYWFSASGRAIRMSLKVSTSYESMYLGYMLPYATPGQYPYPLVVAGSLSPQTSSRGAEWRYSYANWRHGAIASPGAASTPSTENIWASMYLREPDGSWRWFANRPNSGTASADGIYGADAGTSAPYDPLGGWRGVWPHSVNNYWTAGKRPYRECLGGGYLLQPCILHQWHPTVQVLGELEGVYSISGYQNAPENTTEWGGKTAVLFGAAYRTTVHEFWAMTLD